MAFKIESHHIPTLHYIAYNNAINTYQNIPSFLDYYKPPKTDVFWFYVNQLCKTYTDKPEDIERSSTRYLMTQFTNSNYFRNYTIPSEPNDIFEPNPFTTCTIWKKGDRYNYGHYNDSDKVLIINDEKFINTLITHCNIIRIIKWFRDELSIFNIKILGFPSDLYKRISEKIELYIKDLGENNKNISKKYEDLFKYGLLSTALLSGEEEIVINYSKNKSERYLSDELAIKLAMYGKSFKVLEKIYPNKILFQKCLYQLLGYDIYKEDFTRKSTMIHYLIITNNLDSINYIFNFIDPLVIYKLITKEMFYSLIGSDGSIELFELIYNKYSPKIRNYMLEYIFRNAIENNNNELIKHILETKEKIYPSDFSIPACALKTYNIDTYNIFENEIDLYIQKYISMIYDYRISGTGDMDKYNNNIRETGDNIFITVREVINFILINNLDERLLLFILKFVKKYESPLLLGIKTLSDKALLNFKERYINYYDIYEKANKRKNTYLIDFLDSTNSKLFT